ncbi:ABC transporter ATP-binding protein [Microlunatus speluncae]|uniref:ABC transporter ATP-binding protein n=1 Tax=Microlunatus speluncae TaxID=2594267 RepID=UPI0012667E28|nr:ABC transporter ATP-binding protein [Microlunatus speluncae]
MAVIEVTELHKRYRDKIALRGVSFAVERGEIFGILGPNGAGKTTTVECVNGLRRPDSGSVRVLGLDPQRDGRRLRHRVGVQLQESELPERLTVREALGLYASFYPDPADPDRLIDDWGLTEKRNAAFARLSGGQKQRLFIALALIGNPEIAVLDELTTGLDPQARRGAWSLIEAIRDRGVTVVLVTHFMEEAERLCDRIAVINDGRIVALDTPAGLVDRVAGGQRIRFRPSAAVPDGLLSSLPEVIEVQQSGGQLTITGSGPVLQSVAVALHRQDIRAEDLHLERATLEDAFVTLTGRPFEN